MPKRVVITVNEIETNNAGPKAKTDIDKILKSKDDFQVINLAFNWHSKFLKLRYVTWDIPHLMRTISADEIFFQFPSYSRTLMDSFIKNIRRYTDARLIFIVHDLESLRNFSYDPTYKPEEMKWLREADGLIVHNPSMAKWLKKNGIDTPMAILGFFDYLNPQPINKSAELDGSVCFAGNLKKASFLAKLPKKLALDVFGPNFNTELQDRVNYKGVYSPDELPKYLKEDFGLIWDGDSIDECNGLFGNYLRYNCPHKASLYLSSGLPIIVWKKAAIAEYVEQYNLGYTINSLSELPKVMSQLNENKYWQMKGNVLELAERLRKGQNILSAVKRLELLMS